MPDNIVDDSFLQIVKTYLPRRFVQSVCVIDMECKFSLKTGANYFKYDALPLGRWQRQIFRLLPRNRFERNRSLITVNFLDDNRVRCNWKEIRNAYSNWNLLLMLWPSAKLLACIKVVSVFPSNPCFQDAPSASASTSASVSAYIQNRCLEVMQAIIIIQRMDQHCSASLHYENRLPRLVEINRKPVRARKTLLVLYAVNTMPLPHVCPVPVGCFSHNPRNVPIVITVHFFHSTIEHLLWFAHCIRAWIHPWITSPCRAVPCGMCIALKISILVLVCIIMGHRQTWRRVAVMDFTSAMLQ